VGGEGALASQSLKKRRAPGRPVGSADGKTAMFFLTESGEPGPERFLRTIVVPGETGRQLMASSAESQAELTAARAASGLQAQPRSGD
jgi:hypothetical protein